MKFVVFQDTDTRWYWEMRSVDEAVIAIGASGFADIEQAFDAIRSVRQEAPEAPVQNMLGVIETGA
jgi:uncharacterized protein YegP (UPF0339 family)